MDTEVESFRIEQDNKIYIVSSSLRNGNKLVYSLHPENDPNDKNLYYNELTIEDLQNLNPVFKIYNSVKEVKNGLNLAFNSKDPQIGIDKKGDNPILIFYTKLGVDDRYSKIPLDKIVKNIDESERQDYDPLPPRFACPNEEELDMIENNLKNQEEDIGNLRKEIDELKNKTKEAKENGKYLEKEYLDLLKENTNLQLDNDNLKKEVKKLEEEHQKLKKESVDLVKSNQNLENDLKRKYDINLENFRKEEERQKDLLREEELRRRKKELEDEKKTKLRKGPRKIKKDPEPVKKVQGEIVRNNVEVRFVSSQIFKNNKKNLSFNLIYKGSTDGDTAQAFHNRCDPVDRTVVLIETKDGKRFGGYTGQSWKGNNEEKFDKTAFVFNLDQMKIYENKSGQTAIGCYPSAGPVFMGYQIFVQNRFLTNGGFTCEEDLNYCTEQDYEINGGIREFGIKDVEIYSVEFKE